MGLYLYVLLLLCASAPGYDGKVPSSIAVLRRPFINHRTLNTEWSYCIAVLLPSGYKHYDRLSKTKNIFLLAPAHCFYECEASSPTSKAYPVCTRSNKNDYSVHIGDFKYFNEGTSFDIEKLIEHPDFSIHDYNNRCEMNNDLAVVVIRGNLPQQSVLNLPQEGPYKYFNKKNKCDIISWDMNNKNNDIPHFMNAKLPIKPDPFCIKSLRLANASDVFDNRGYCSVKHTCTLDNGAKNAPCNAQTGGIITCDNKLIGMVAFIGSKSEEHCRDKHKTTVYTRIDNYRDWIRGVIKNF